MEDKYKDIRDKISAARIELMRRHPFYASLAFSLEVVIDDTLAIPTAAVSNSRMMFHPNFVKKLTHSELVFLTAHEVMHPALLHLTRRNDRDPMVWNLAADVVINRLLIESQVGTMPAGGIDDAALYARGDGVTDNIYDLLINDQSAVEKLCQGGKGDGSDGQKGALETLIEGGEDGEPQTEAEKAAQETKWKVKLATAAIEAQKAGAMPAGLRRFVDNLLQPKVPWQTVLMQFTRPAKTDDRTWAKPNRRYMAHKMYMPGFDGVETDEIVVAVDCSGSINGELLSQFAAELRSIQEDTRPVCIHVVYFDSEVSHHDTFDLTEEVDVQPHGGGGTAFSPIFRFIADNEINAACCVVLTDLCCNDFGPEPSYPVLWVSTMQGTAPWGQVVIM